MRERLFVLLFGAALATLAWVWRFGSVPPDMMEDLAVAAGLRPPTAPFGLLWQYIAGPLCRNFGLATAELVLGLAGHVALGLAAVICVFTFAMRLPASFLRGLRAAAWWRRLVRFVLCFGVLLFCCSEPVWHAFRWLSPQALQVLLALLAAAAFFAHLASDRRAPLFVSFMLVGLLASDTPSGFVLLVAAAVALGVRREMRKAGVAETPEESPFAGALMAWRLTIAFGFAFAAGIALVNDRVGVGKREKAGQRRG